MINSSQPFGKWPINLLTPAILCQNKGGNSLHSNKIHPWQVDLEVSTHLINNCLPGLTVVMPVFNQELIIIKTLQHLCDNLTTCFNLIVINDGSDDGTSDCIHKFIDSMCKSYPLLHTVTVIENKYPIYETACDNQGFRLAKTEIIIEVQADIFITDPGFEKKMIDVSSSEDVGTVSGRLVHPFSLMDGRRAWIKYPFEKLMSIICRDRQSVGLIGSRVFTGYGANLNGAKFYIGETNARGPWLIKKSDLIDLDYLDENSFFLGYDDHDFNRRLFEHSGKLAAYVPVTFESPADFGSTRKSRSGLNLEIYNYLKNHKTGSLNFKAFMRNYKPYGKTTGIF